MATSGASQLEEGGVADGGGLGGLEGTGWHLGSRYVCSHVEEAAVKVEVLREEKDPEVMVCIQRFFVVVFFRPA